jgi:hypothetical protein
MHYTLKKIYFHIKSLASICYDSQQDVQVTLKRSRSPVMNNYKIRHSRSFTPHEPAVHVLLQRNL